MIAISLPLPVALPPVVGLAGAVVAAAVVFVAFAPVVAVGAAAVVLVAAAGTVVGVSAAPPHADNSIVRIVNRTTILNCFVLNTAFPPYVSYHLN